MVIKYQYCIYGWKVGDRTLLGHILADNAIDAAEKAKKRIKIPDKYNMIWAYFCAEHRKNQGKPIPSNKQTEATMMVIRFMKIDLEEKKAMTKK